MLEGERNATSTERHPERWVERVERKGLGWVEATPLTRGQEADEMLLMGLRLAEGVDLHRLATKAGAAPSAATVAELSALGLIETVAAAPEEWRIRATGKGRFVLNEIVLRLALGFDAPRARACAMDIRPAAD